MTKGEYEALEKQINEKKLTLLAKRLIDILGALFLLILFTPVMLILAPIVIMESGFPFFFTQVRMGIYGYKFKIYKLRTMKVGSATADGITYQNDKRITKAGAFLRKYRLDEVPQLINIIKGDMSFVGPRPDLPKYYEANDFAYKAVLLVRPGLTGNATLRYMDEDQILSKSENPEITYINEVFPEKIKMNIEYIRALSVFNDIKLLLVTFKRVLHKK